MRTLAYVVVTFSVLSSFASNADETCANNQRKLHPGEPCIPEPLFNYLYCLSNSGGGKIEVVKKEQTETTKDLEINVQGKGSGVVIKAEGGGGFKSSEASRAGKELSEKLDPTLAAHCESILKDLETPPKKPFMGALLWNTNLQGHDIANIDKPDVNTAGECSNQCLKNDQCMAMTFVKHSSQPGGICWLKNAVPSSSPNPSMASAIKVFP